MNTEELLRNRETLLRWREPRTGVDAEGNAVTGVQHKSITVADAINYQRWSTASVKGFAHALGVNEGTLLNDFITVHWADVDVK